MVVALWTRVSAPTWTRRPDGVCLYVICRSRHAEAVEVCSGSGHTLDTCEWLPVYVCVLRVCTYLKVSESLSFSRCPALVFSLTLRVVRAYAWRSRMTYSSKGEIVFAMINAGESGLRVWRSLVIDTRRLFEQGRVVQNVVVVVPPFQRSEIVLYFHSHLGFFQLWFVGPSSLEELGN